MASLDQLMQVLAEAPQEEVEALTRNAAAADLLDEVREAALSMDLPHVFAGLAKGSRADWPEWVQVARHDSWKVGREMIRRGHVGPMTAYVFHKMPPEIALELARRSDDSLMAGLAPYLLQAGNYEAAAVMLENGPQTYLSETPFMPMRRERHREYADSARMLEFLRVFLQNGPLLLGEMFLAHAPLFTMNPSYSVELVRMLRSQGHDLSMLMMNPGDKFTQAFTEPEELAEVVRLIYDPQYGEPALLQAIQNDDRELARQLHRLGARVVRPG